MRYELFFKLFIPREIQVRVRLVNTRTVITFRLLVVIAAAGVYLEKKKKKKNKFNAQNKHFVQLNHYIYI